MSKETDVPFSLDKDGVKVVVKKMTKEEARKEFPYRPFQRGGESPFGGNDLYDDVCLLLNGLAQRCKMCSAATKKEYLHEGVCPDCDGRSELRGLDPRLPADEYRRHLGAQ